MSLKKFEFGFGNTTQSVELPEEHVREVLHGRKVPAVDVKEATLQCMRHPIASKPLQDLVSKGDKVCLVVADITRIWNCSREFLIHIVNELNLAGIPDDDMFIVFAQGSHRAHKPEEDIAVAGEEVVRRIRTYQHNCLDKEQLTLVGTTRLGTPVWINKRVAEADKIIVVGGITPHLFAGYGGGRKLILPGVASFETIQKNHCHALADRFGDGINPKTRNCLIDDNPVSDDMIEAMHMVNPVFMVNSIINAEGKICNMIGGDPDKAWVEGTKIVYENQKVSIKGRSDVTFACAGGYPKDISLYQGCKCYDPSDETTKKGGIIIAIMEARDIHEPPAYLDSFKYDTEAEMEKALRDCFTIPFFVAFNLFCMTHRYTIYLVTKPENFDEVRRTNQIPVATVEEAWKLAEAQLKREGKEDYTITIIPHCGAVVPFHPEA